MPLFKPKQLPSTSYGYQAPMGATAKGWRCPNRDCGRGEWEPVKRWPVICECGTLADPVFDEPWAHDARGVELRWNMASAEDQGFSENYWPAWHYRDSVLKSDQSGCAEARREATEISSRKLATESWWIPGSLWWQLVGAELNAGDIDGAAQDLVYWLSISSAENVETDNSNRTNCRQVIDKAINFASSPDGQGHPLAPQIRSSCLELAAGAFSVLSAELQTGINRMAREGN